MPLEIKILLAHQHLIVLFASIIASLVILETVEGFLSRHLAYLSIYHKPEPIFWKGFWSFLFALSNFPQTMQCLLLYRVFHLSPNQGTNFFPKRNSLYLYRILSNQSLLRQARLWIIQRS